MSHPGNPSARPTAPVAGTASPPTPAPGTAGVDDDHRPHPVDTSEESVAGEEDPGASLDLPAEPPAARPESAVHGTAPAHGRGRGQGHEPGPGR